MPRKTGKGWVFPRTSDRGDRGSQTGQVEFACGSGSWGGRHPDFPQRRADGRLPRRHVEKKRGRIGLQLHAGVHQKMLFRNLCSSRRFASTDYPNVLGLITSRRRTPCRIGTRPRRDRWKNFRHPVGPGQGVAFARREQEIQTAVSEPVQRAALLKNQVLGDFVLTARVQTLQKTTGHRDYVCVLRVAGSR